MTHTHHREPTCNILRLLSHWDNTNITSCWGTDGLGICVVKKDKKKEWQERLNCLKNTIDYWIVPENKTNKTIETIELFYDE